MKAHPHNVVIDFDYNDQSAYLAVYAQDIVLSIDEKVVVKELLVRGFYQASGQMIPMLELLAMLDATPELLLQLTQAQLKAAVDLITRCNCDKKYSINIAASLLTDEHLFASLWQSSLQMVPTELQNRVIFEISEAEVSVNTMRARAAHLSAANFLIALDDFGAAHSNLVRLRSLQHDIIKLDLQLLKEVPEDLWATSCYERTVELCAATGAYIIAEGIENQIQADFVRWVGADAIQGFYYSTPYPLTVST